MSVHYGLEPYWGYHRLADLYEPEVRRIAKRYGFDDWLDQDEIGHKTALRMCLGGRQVMTKEAERNRFLALCKYECLNLREKRRQETPIAKLRGDEDDSSDMELLGRLGGSTKAMQEISVEVSEVLGAIKGLPKAHRRVMEKLAIGHTPIDIALSEQRDIRDVLHEIKVARDWIHDVLKWGDGDFVY